MPPPLCRPPKPQAPGPVGTSKTHSSSCIAVKLGKCPLDQLHCLSPIKHMCNQDSNCPGKKRCCLSACGRDCRDPSKGTIPGGHDRTFFSSLARACPSKLAISAGHLPQKRGPPDMAIAGEVGWEGSHEHGRETVFLSSEHAVPPRPHP